MKEVKVFTKSVYLSGVGKFASVLKHNEHAKLIQKAVTDTTNQRIGLEGVIASLESLNQPCKVEVISNNDYIVKGINIYLVRWINNGWKRSNGKEVANLDLWQKVASLAIKHKVTAIKATAHPRLVELAQLAE